jgi:hypothetical protein
LKRLVIAFFHMGVSPYQKFNLDLAVRRNPGAEVVLLTDTSEAYYPDGVRIFDISSHSEMIKEFRSVYVHKNTCTWLFEFRSLIRWLIYNEWWKNNQDCNLFIADSDVMIFSDLAKEMPKWAGYSHTLSMRTAGGQSFWFVPQALQTVVDVVWSTYRDKESPAAQKILSHYGNLQDAGKPGGVCDMTFLAAAAELGVMSVGETTEIIDGATYDHNILMAGGYLFDGQRKEIEWRDGYPYCRSIGGHLIRFHTLHMSCSGGLVEGFYNRARASE